MIVLKPFKAIRPAQKYAPRVAALPYDVMNSQEAKGMADGNPYSFLHIGKAEITLDESMDPYDPRVYERAKENLDSMIDDKVLVKDQEENLYIYKQLMEGKEQIGIVGCLSVDDYMEGRIKKHENTIEEKQRDRMNHTHHCNSNTGPIFLTYRSRGKIDVLIQNWMEDNTPVYDFVSDDNIAHQVWVIDDRIILEKLIKQFRAVDSLYIADGHHRTAAAAEVARMRRDAKPDYSGQEEFNFFLGVLFPHDQLYIMDYNRLVEDLNGHDVDEFLERLKENFIIKEVKEGVPYRPEEKHSFGMYLDKNWYKLIARNNSFDMDDSVESLDASILQNNLLKPILGIDDPRTNKRIDFVGGIRGLKELEDRVDGGMAVAFSLYPTAIDDLMVIADEGRTMPPKSTWFEPKLRSGLFIHDLE